MERKALTDGSGRWFDESSAVKFRETRRHNGNNWISRATGSQWNHEWLFYTRSGRWVLNCFSDYQGSLETYEEIDESDAIAWLICNERFDEVSELPAAIRHAVLAGIESAEV